MARREGKKKNTAFTIFSSSTSLQRKKGSLGSRRPKRREKRELRKELFFLYLSLSNYSISGSDRKGLIKKEREGGGKEGGEELFFPPLLAIHSLYLRGREGKSQGLEGEEEGRRKREKKKKKKSSSTFSLSRARCEEGEEGVIKKRYFIEKDIKKEKDEGRSSVLLSSSSILRPSPSIAGRKRGDQREKKREEGGEGAPFFPLPLSLGKKKEELKRKDRAKMERGGMGGEGE